MTADIRNGDFEKGRDGSWAERSLKGFQAITNDLPNGVKAHSGAWLSWLGGANDETTIVEQQLTVPVERPYLRYWLWIASTDACGYDVGGVILNLGGDVEDEDIFDAYWLCRSTNTGGWVRQTVDIRARAGKTVMLSFLGGTDGSSSSSLLIDDVSFVSSMGAGRRSDWRPIGEGLAIPRVRQAFDTRGATVPLETPGRAQP